MPKIILAIEDQQVELADYRSFRALLGVFEDLGECDHDASGGVLEGRGD